MIYYITQFLKYSPAHSDAVTVNEAIDAMRKEKYALVGSQEDVIKILRYFGYTEQEVATRINYALNGAPQSELISF